MTNSNKTHTQLSLEQVSDNRFSLRALLTIGFGLIVAGGLTWFMHALIEASHQELDDSIRANFLDFVRVKRNETSEKKQTKPQRPTTEQTPPAPPAPQADSQSMSDTSIAVSMPSVSTDINVDVGGIGLGMGDGEYLPIVKFAPTYPMKAMQKGMEGSCTVQYTVTTTGATKDIKVVAGECPSVFMRSSIRAAGKFKYKPKIVDGKAIEVPNVYNRFDFFLQQQEGEQ